MMFTGDYHTHTKFSDGKGTVMQNAVAAREAGLCEVAITDHGFNIPTMGLKKYLRAKEQCRIAAAETGIKVIAGVEANLISLDGTLDVKEKDLDKIDYLIMGYHKFALPKNVKTFFAMYFITYFNGLFRPTKAAVNRNTQAVIKCIERYPVKVLCHINHGLKVDVNRVAEACRQKGVAVEINAKHLKTLVPVMQVLVNSGVNFVINSDAHSPREVGVLSRAYEFALKNGVTPSRILNCKEE